MKIEITDLPEDITPEAIAELFPEPDIIINTELERRGDPDAVIAWVEVDASRVQAQVLAERIAGGIHFDRRIGAHVPLFG